MLLVDPMRLAFASILVLVLASVPAAANEPPRLSQTMGIDLRRLDPAPKVERRAIALFSRATYPAIPHVRGGVEVGAGWAHLRAPLPKATTARLDDEGVFYYGAVIASLAFSAGPARMGAEVAAGVRAVDTTFAWMVEPRLKVELRLKPDLAIGARVGSELLRSDDIVGGVYGSLHTW